MIFFTGFKGVWRGLNTPDDFKGDWYGALTNQAGHQYLGMLIAASFILSYSFYFGELPYKIPTLVGITFLYYTVIEVFTQKSGFLDSWVDSGHILLGASVITSLGEVEYKSLDKITLELNGKTLLTVMGLSALALIYTVINSMKKE